VCFWLPLLLILFYATSRKFGAAGAASLGSVTPRGRRVFSPFVAVVVSGRFFSHETLMRFKCLANQSRWLLLSLFNEKGEKERMRSVDSPDRPHNATPATCRFNKEIKEKSCDRRSRIEFIVETITTRSCICVERRKKAVWHRTISIETPKKQNYQKCVEKTKQNQPADVFKKKKEKNGGREEPARCEIFSFHRWMASFYLAFHRLSSSSSSSSSSPFPSSSSLHGLLPPPPRPYRIRTHKHTHTHKSTKWFFIFGQEKKNLRSRWIGRYLVRFLAWARRLPRGLWAFFSYFFFAFL